MSKSQMLHLVARLLLLSPQIGGPGPPPPWAKIFLLILSAGRVKGGAHGLRNGLPQADMGGRADRRTGGRADKRAGGCVLGGKCFFFTFFLGGWGKGGGLPGAPGSPARAGGRVGGQNSDSLFFESSKRDLIPHCMCPRPTHRMMV